MDVVFYGCYSPWENDTEYDFEMRVSTNGSFENPAFCPKKKGDKWKTCRLVKNDKWKSLANSLGIKDPEPLDIDFRIKGIIIGFTGVMYENRLYKVSEFLCENSVFRKPSPILYDKNLQNSKSFLNAQLSNMESAEVECSSAPEISSILPAVLQDYGWSFYRIQFKNIDNVRPISDLEVTQKLERAMFLMKSTYRSHNCYLEFNFRGRILYLCQMKFLETLTYCICFDTEFRKQNHRHSSKDHHHISRGGVTTLFHDAVIVPTEMNNNGKRFRRIQISDEFRLDHLQMVLENIIDENFLAPDIDYCLLFKGDSIEDVDIRIENSILRIDSTNDFFLAWVWGDYEDYKTLWLTLLAILVYIMQMAILTLVIRQEFNVPKVQAKSFELILIRILISVYLSISLARSLAPESLETFSSTDSPYWLRILMFHVVPIIAIIFQFSPSRIQFTLIFMDYCLIVVAVGATLLITKLQNDILSTVFNFSGLLIILDFDEIVAFLFQYKKKRCRLVTSLKKEEKSLVDTTTLCITLVICAYSLYYLLS